MENPVKSPPSAPALPAVALQPNDTCVIPDELPVYIDPRARIAKDGKVENLAEFGKVGNIFDFSRCLGCIRMIQENYGSCTESPCMKCERLARKIEDANR